MTCPRCRIDYNPEAWDDCPHCGELLTIVSSGVVKSSTILIAAGANSEPGFYRSVEEVPESLRKMLVKSTSGLNSGTIFIADRRGKEEISKAIRNLPRRAGAGEVPRLPGSTRPNGESWRDWRSPSAILFGALLALFTSAVGWIVFTHTW